MDRVKSKKYNGVYVKALKDGDISYSIVFKDIHNKTQRMNIGRKSRGITEQYCNNKRNELLNQMTLGEQPLSLRKRAKINAITLQSVTDKYFDSLLERANLRSIGDRKSKFKKHLGVLANKSVSLITKQEFLDIKNDMINQEYAPTTINQVMELFGTIFNYGLKEGLYNLSNPAISIHRLEFDNARDRFLNKDEIKRLFEHFSSNETMTLFIKLALTTGARLQGILAIQKKDIDLQQMMINMNDFKTKSTYKAFITDDLAMLLSKKLANMQPNDYIFTKNTQKMTSRHIQEHLKPALDKLFNEGLALDDRKNRVVIHTLRHTFASHLAINGTPIYTIQRLMNHKDISMTLRYAKLAPDSGRNEVNRLYR